MDLDASEIFELADQLTKGATEAPRHAGAVVEATAEATADTMRALAPVATGATRDSIAATGPDGGPLGRSLEAEIGPTTDWAPFAEHGTEDTPPQAFVGPAPDPHVADFASDAAGISDHLL